LSGLLRSRVARPESVRQRNKTDVVGDGTSEASTGPVQRVRLAAGVLQFAREPVRRTFLGIGDVMSSWTDIDEDEDEAFGWTFADEQKKRNAIERLEAQ